MLILEDKDEGGYQFVDSNLGVEILLKKREYHKKSVEIEWRGFSVHFVLEFQDNSIFTLLMFWLRYYKIVQSLYKKLTPCLKNHIRNLNNFRQAVESPKS